MPESDEPRDEDQEQPEEAHDETSESLDDLAEAGPSARDQRASRARLPLLTLITQQALDEDYVDAAERRAAGVPHPPRLRAHRTAAVVVGCFGLLVATAAVQTSQDADATQANRSVLISKIGDERLRVADQQARAAALRDSTTAADSALTRLTDSDQQAAARLRRLQVRTGFIPVTGPGVRITVTQSPTAEEDISTAVRDLDLTLVANGLWESGAEAISINGQRITTTTAIRSAGDAIEVNNIGTAPPWVISAIGDRRTLAADLLDTSSGLTFAGLSQFYGFGFEIDNVEELRLPAAPQRKQRLRSVEIPTTSDTSDGAGPQDSGRPIPGEGDGS